MRKEPRSAYDKWNVSLVICDIYSATVEKAMVAMTSI
jgi:hypothetical protein